MTIRVLSIALAVAGMFASATVSAQTVPEATIQSAIASSWSATAADWLKRLDQDDMQRQCTAARNAPGKDLADRLQAAARASIQYPADGKLMGDWKKGETLAQSGYGMRFTDTDTARPNGGNCYACHQITKAELSFGTLGPPLIEYGKTRKFAEADVKAVYEKIYNSHAAFPCSSMPRFGVAGVLTVEQITHLVALLMDKDSPVNK